MTKQRGRGGKKGRKAKKGFASRRELTFKEDGQEYGQIIKLLGNSSATVHCFDGKIRLGVICGRMRNRVWIAMNDVILVSLREFEDGGKKCDIIMKYFPEEAKQLKALGELPENIEIEERALDPEEEKINLKFDEGQDEEGYDEDDDDDIDMPPGSSDEEFWEKEKEREELKAENKRAGIKDDEDDDEDDEEEEEVMAEKEPKGKKDLKPDPKKPAPVAPGKAGAPPGKPNLPSKQDQKKADTKKKQDGKKKKTLNDSSSEEDDKLADI